MLEEVAKRSGFKLNFKEALIGGAALDAKDDPFPDETLKAWVMMHDDDDDDDDDIEWEGGKQDE